MWAKWWLVFVSCFVCDAGMASMEFDNSLILCFFSSSFAVFKIARQTRVEWPIRMVGNCGGEIPLVAEQVARAIECTRRIHGSSSNFGFQERNKMTWDSKKKKECDPWLVEMLNCTFIEMYRLSAMRWLLISTFQRPTERPDFYLKTKNGMKEKTNSLVNK